jgi:hypothetical protein
MAMGSMLGAQALAVGGGGASFGDCHCGRGARVCAGPADAVSEDDERQGLDIASHGERGWEFD